MAHHARSTSISGWTDRSYLSRVSALGPAFRGTSANEQSTSRSRHPGSVFGDFTRRNRFDRTSSCHSGSNTEGGVLGKRFRDPEGFSDANKRRGTEMSPSTHRSMSIALGSRADTPSLSSMGVRTINEDDEGFAGSRVASPSSEPGFRNASMNHDNHPYNWAPPVIQIVEEDDADRLHDSPTMTPSEHSSRPATCSTTLDKNGHHDQHTESPPTSTFGRSNRADTEDFTGVYSPCQSSTGFTANNGDEEHEGWNTSPLASSSRDPLNQSFRKGPHGLRTPPETPRKQISARFRDEVHEEEDHEEGDEPRVFDEGEQEEDVDEEHRDGLSTPEVQSHDGSSHEAAGDNGRSAVQVMDRVFALLQSIVPQDIRTAPSYDEVYPQGMRGADGILEKLNALNQWLPQQQKAAVNAGQNDDQTASSQHSRENPRQKRSTRKKPKTAYFWEHFLQLESVSDLPEPNEFTRMLMSEPSLETLFSDLPLRVGTPDPPAAGVNVKNAMDFNAAVNLMEAVHGRDAQNNLLRMLLHLFFFLAAHPDWADSSQKQRMPRVSDRKGEALYDDYLGLVRHHTRGAVYVMPRTEFLRKISHWVSVGSKYAFFASQLSLGCLVHLQHLLTPAAMQSCSKGNESAKVGSVSISEHALSHLRRIGLLEKAESADAMMHVLLWALMGQFRGVEGPASGRAKFPGFA